MIHQSKNSTNSFSNLKRLNKKSLFLLAALKVIFLIDYIKNISFSNCGTNLIRLVLIYTLTFLPPLTLASSPVYAADLPITPDGSTNTQIDSAANNVPIVNIAAPNSGGLSHNKFIDYNVNPNGLIINNAINSPNGIITTHLGGIITDNTNLANSGAASVILNEVTSTNKSYLNGYTEIAGRQADLIIANPNGIQMNGAGFINVSRLTAIVGSSNQFNPNPNDLTFNLAGNRNAGNDFLPKLTIFGLGLDVEEIVQTDLIANIMEIVAPIYGGDNVINLRAGDKEFNFSTKEVTSDNSNPGSNQPDEIAIDASNLANIQAGQIYMVATKEGFGVKYSGDMLASRGGVKIDANGNITYGNIASEVGNIEVRTTNGDIVANGIAQTKDVNNDVILEASSNIINYGQLLSARNISLTAGNVFSNQGAEINLSENDFIINAAGIENLGILSSNNDFTIDNALLLINQGVISAANNINITSDQIISNQIIASNDLTINSRELTSNDIIAGNKLSITATDFLINYNDILSLTDNLLDQDGNPENSLIINTGTLTNEGRIAGNGNLRIDANVINSLGESSLIKANDIVIVSTTSLENQGSIEAINNLTITSDQIISNEMIANNNLTITSRELTSNDIIAGNKLSITATDFLINHNDILSLTENLLDQDGNPENSLIINTGTLTNHGRIAANGNLRIDANILNSTDVTSLIKANDIIIVSTTSLENQGSIEAINNLTITSDQIISNEMIANND
ncbi:MAG: filamentous hemagglutinin, partial [Rickettsiales bacterium]